MLRKKYWVIPVIILVISVVFITGPVAASSGCQTWYLNSTTHNAEPHEVMQKADISTNNVTVGIGQSNIWVADEMAASDVTFSGNWVIELESCTDSTDWREYFTALAGIWDPIENIFTPFNAIGFIREYPSPYIIRIIHKSGWNTIPQGSYGSFLMSCSDPGYPLPEIAAGVLLFVGLIGLGIHIGIKRKKTAS